jgi:O-antigen ligase
MEIGKFRSFLQNGGAVYLYATFIAGYFLLPMAAGHRRLYYVLVIPAALLLWQELAAFYRGNALSGLFLIYTGYMMSTLLWSADFDWSQAALALWYSLCLVTFCAITGYLWMQHRHRLETLARRSTWLAAAAALVSIVAWYLEHPFPASRLVPLGVMHHPNKAACGYGIFLILSIHFYLQGRGRSDRLWYLVAGAVLISLILFTQSRTAVVATSAALLALVGYRAIGLVAIVLAASWALLAANTALWESRVLTLSFRPGIWQQVIAEMPGHWLLGRGYLVDPQVTAYEKLFNHAHNSYLATLRDGGAVGLVLLLGLLGLALVWAGRLWARGGERIYLALLLFGMTAVTMDFDRLLVHPKELWLFFWLPLALVMAAYPAWAGSRPSPQASPA